ncbi:hypothetical protein ABB37_03409 [Leptomonas pyrrhocoris]|uniref:Uncharacterized protein n=1 Tax=Leptomonas pyrrhocoris TaxID=157538 RepID=A0A0M9G4V7_LEPPY|nr:hypothetical protein ABB37_03409 [Leptomonas pyrrhocoris]KPA82313.1 hypothetical protein ABB37_03409 [Leptomonas pyrrhocoris]|eukprot:XP_015660752.1 hypothetical protein ABB37_03409 [Leptomonas pyrrhocoris]
MTQRNAGPTSSFDDAADVTHSTAFAVLNALVDEGQISDERAEYLKQKFTELHSRVLAIYKRDNALLKRARQLRSRLEAERQNVLSCGDSAKKDDEIIQSLKRTLMEQERDLTAALERESVLQVEVLEYDRRKQHLILDREDAVAAEEARLRPKMEALQSEIADMSNHIKEVAGEQEQADAELARLTQEEAQHRSVIANFDTTLAQARQQLQNVQKDPERAQRQLDLVLGSLSGAERELGSTEEKIAAHAQRIAALEFQRNSRTGDFEAVKKRVLAIRTEMESKRKTLATMNTSLEVELEARQSTQERVAELEQLLLTTKFALQQEMDGVDRMEREKEKYMRVFSSLEQAKDNARHEWELLQEQVRLVEREVEQVNRTTAGVKKECESYRKDIEVRTRKLLAEQAKSKEFVGQADRVLMAIREVEDTLAAKVKQDEVKQRELKALATKRQELSRASAREATRLTLAQQEMQMRQMYVKEARRRGAELEKRLNKLVDMFQKVKRERAQKATQIQTITQAMTQVAEKTKLLERELSVLKRESTLKEQEITKSKYQAHELTQICANLRLEKNRLRKKLEKATDREREVKSQVRRLNADIAATEDTMTDLRRSYAAAVEGRNQVGIQLIDRNDEAALLVARVTAQESAIAEGTKMTNASAVEVRLLKAKLANLLRDIEACQQSLPKVTQMELELTRVQDEMEAEQWRAQVLEEDLTDPKNPHRWKHIPLAIASNTAVPVVSDEVTTPVRAVGRREAAGSQEGNAAPVPTVAASSPSSPADAAAAVTSAATLDQNSAVNASATLALVGGPSEEYVRLQARCQELESRMQTITAKLREKDLILEEVSELAERVGGQAESGKDVTLALAKQVNKYHSNIRGKSRQMMATISELSLFQASSIQLQQEVQRLEAVVAEAEQRMATGDAPFAEAEEQYERRKQVDERYAAARQQRRQAAQAAEAREAAQAIATTAEQRPNAYIPEDDKLGLARPYGPFAPFKSSTTRVMLTPARTAAAWSTASNRGMNSTPAQSQATQPAASPASSSPSSRPAAAHQQSGTLPLKARGPTTPPASFTSASPVGSGAVVTSFSSSLPRNRRVGQEPQYGAATASPAMVAASEELHDDSDAVDRNPNVASSLEQLRVSERGLSGDSSSRRGFSATQ